MSFLISFNASVNVKNADISWNIKTEEQLRQWAYNQSNKIIKMLNKLKSQWDMTLKLNEQWIVVQVKHDKRLNQLKIEQMIINTLEETNKRYQEKMLNLKNKLKEVLHSINQLSLHHFHDHKIELIDEEMSSRSRLYQMFNHKLQKIKKYLIKHLNKEFIFFSFTSYISLILFIKKKDDSLHFCVNYKKLNALIKRDYYSLSLIDEILACIQESKYLTWLNIIVVFNKLRMHSDNEDLTIFIIFFNLYKYHVMLFELINESTFY